MGNSGSSSSQEGQPSPHEPAVTALTVEALARHANADTDEVTKRLALGGGLQGAPGPPAFRGARPLTSPPA